MRRASLLALASIFSLATSLAVSSIPAAATHDPAKQANIDDLFHDPTGTVNSDIAFWGNRAYVGNYDGFRIYDISDPATPVRLVDFQCEGPQNDPVVWENRLLFLAVDRTMEGPECGSAPTDHDDPNGWEGVRIFDVSNPRAPRQIGSVYTDCGAHTITMYPKNPAQILLYVSSYPLRPGPTCGQERFDNRDNPYDGDPGRPGDPLHGVIQIIKVPLNNPTAAKETREAKIVYPGDPDNRIVWSEHGLPGPPVLEPAARACHDIAVLVDTTQRRRAARGGLAGAACAEQAQLWRIRPNGMPDTRNPIWVYDDEVDETGITGNPADPGVVVDFWHSATFSWDGEVVNFIDESFGDGCPPVTENSHHPGDTGRMFFLDVDTGEKLSHFMLPRPEPDAYCSAHLGNVVPATDRNLLVNAWYMGGLDVIDFTDPADPVEVGFWDAEPEGSEGSDNWSAYWYEGPELPGNTLTLYATDGVHSPENGRGFMSFVGTIPANEVNVDHLNPQTQHFILD